MSKTTLRQDIHWLIENSLQDDKFDSKDPDYAWHIAKYLTDIILEEVLTRVGSFKETLGE